MRDLCFRHARRAAEQLVKRTVGHRETGQVVEVLLVESERPILLQINELVQNQVAVFRLAVRRQPHQLVLAGIDLEAGVVGKGRVEQAERVGPVELLEELYFTSTANPERRRRPFPNTVHGENSGLFERGGKERAGRMGLVMLRVQNIPIVLEGIVNLLVYEQLVLDPEWPRLQKGSQPSRCDPQVRLQDPLEFEQRLVVEANEGEVLGRDASLTEAVVHRARGERRIALFAREPLLLRRGDDLAVTQQASGAVVVECRNA